MSFVEATTTEVNEDARNCTANSKAGFLYWPFQILVETGLGVASVAGDANEITRATAYSSLAGPLRSVLRVNHFPAEPCLKFLGIGLHSKTPYLDVFATANERVTARG